MPKTDTAETTMRPVTWPCTCRRNNDGIRRCRGDATLSGCPLRAEGGVRRPHCPQRWDHCIGPPRAGV